VVVVVDQLTVLTVELVARAAQELLLFLMFQVLQKDKFVKVAQLMH
jgi:hypothetical protein